MKYLSLTITVLTLVAIGQASKDHESSATELTLVRGISNNLFDSDALITAD